MIVCHASEGWEVIHQYAHGLLAGQIAEQIDPSHRPPRWVDTLAAIINHDDYQLDFDERSYLDASGAPLDFMQENPSGRERLAYIQRLLKNSKRKSGWIALLVSMHTEFIYQDAKADNPAMQSFLKEQAEERKRLRRRYGVTKAEAEAAYLFLRFCDRLSLILCRQEVPSAGRRLEINRAMDNQTYYVRQHPADDAALTVEPWCFAIGEFKVAVDVQLLRQLRFKSNQELEKALAEAEVEVREWTFKQA